MDAAGARSGNRADGRSGGHDGVGGSWRRTGASRSRISARAVGRVGGAGNGGGEHLRLGDKVGRGLGGGGHSSRGGGVAASRLAIGSLDVEGVGVLEDAGVAFELEDEAVDIFGTERGVDVPDVGLGTILDSSYTK